MDERTSAICKRMHGKYEGISIPINQNFVDDETGQSFSHPPFHVNCRTALAGVPEEE